ncbi:MAG: serine hydrolase [Patescibacteria group bacterium]|nr:serine hydrolase [Patescibacteria group bacterium]
MRVLFTIIILISLLIVPAQARNLTFTVAHHLTLAKDVVYSGYRDSITEIAGVPITSRSVIVLDAETGEIIYEMKPLLKTPIASITKLMSLIIFIKSQTSLNNIIEAQNSDLENLNQYINEGDNISYLSFYPGDRMRVKDVVYTGMVRSSNNTVSMFVRATGLGEEEFVRQMNEYAQLLGMYDTHFTEPTGLDPKNVSTARDVAILARHAFKNGFIRRVTTTKNYNFQTLDRGLYYQTSNTNGLLSMFQPTYYKVLGGKTGYLDESRFNIATQIKNWQGKEVIVVVLGAETSAKRFHEAKNLAFAAFSEL